MAVIYTPHFVQFFDDNGDPLNGGKLYTYAAGTTTPKATYTDESGGTPNANPVVLDSAGRATVFLSGSYKFRLETSSGALVEETDNVTAFTTGASGLDIVGDYTDTAVATGDSFIFADASDSNNVKRDTIQGILDLVTGTTSGWVPIKQVTANNDATIDFVNGSGGVVLNSTYKTYAIVLSNVVSATDTVSLYFRTSTNAGSSYDSGASDYNWAATGAISSGGGAIDVDTAQSEISLTDAGVSLGNDTLEDLSGIVYLFNPAGTVKSKKIIYDTVYNNPAGAIVRKAGAASRLAAADIDAIRFLMSSGNISSGTFTLYGLAGP